MFKRVSLCVIAVALSAVVSAHGPSRLKVDQTIEINAPADKVWAKVGSFADLSWIPGVAKVEATGGNEVGATRHVILKGDGKATIDEELVAYDATALSYKYKITKVEPSVLPVNNYASTIRVTPSADGKASTLEWKAGFYRGYPNNDPPPELNDDASQAAVEKLYTTTLAALKQSLEAGK